MLFNGGAALSFHPLPSQSLTSSTLKCWTPVHGATPAHTASLSGELWESLNRGLWNQATLGVELAFATNIANQPSWGRDSDQIRGVAWMQRDSPHAKKHFKAALCMCHTSRSQEPGSGEFLSLLLQVPRGLGKCIWKVVLKRLNRLVRHMAWLER